MTGVTGAPILGVVGGSGVEQVEGLQNTRWVEVESPFGKPSDALLTGDLDGQRLVFLPRHGRGHPLSPTDINYRANVDVFKRVGVTEIVSVSAVGSLREELAPGTFVIVDQFIDRTIHREKSFFGAGLVAHVSMARPVCGRLGDLLEEAAREEGLRVVRGGKYLVMEGPQFSSLAESELYRAWGLDVVGMTNMPEAKLAREAEMCYATVAMVTDYDCWHPGHKDVSVEAIVKVIEDNAEKASRLIRRLAPRLGQRDGPCAEGCHRVLDSALITAPEARDPEMVRRLDAVAGRVLKS